MREKWERVSGSGSSIDSCKQLDYAESLKNPEGRISNGKSDHLGMTLEKFEAQLILYGAYLVYHKGIPLPRYKHIEPYDPDLPENVKKFEVDVGTSSAATYRTLSAADKRNIWSIISTYGEKVSKLIGTPVFEEWDGSLVDPSTTHVNTELYKFYTTLADL